MARVRGAALPGAAAAWAVACLAALVPASSSAQVVTQEEALRLAFGPDATVERRTAYLDHDQVGRVEELTGGEPLEQHVVPHYVAREGERPLGVAYFDAHRVRTLPEVLMVVVSPEGRVRRIEVLKFSEPPEYEAPEGWLAQFDGKALGEGLSLKGGIVNMTGATLTSTAVTDAVRRVLALHRVLEPFGPAAGGGSGGHGGGGDG